MKTQGFSNYLRKSIDKQQLTIKETAEKAGISRQNLHKILNGDIAQAKLTTLIQLAHALNKHPLDLFRAYLNHTDFPAINTKEQMVSHYQNDQTGFIGDLTYPDYSLVNTRQVFEKQWKVQNVGQRVWENRRLVCLDEQLTVYSTNDNRTIVHGLKADKPWLAAPRIEPDEDWTISINFTAPDYPCTVISHWKMIDQTGNFCFPESQPLTCLVKVIAL